MLQFSKNFIYYMVIEVLEPNFHKFKQELKKTKTIDDILTLHNNFLDKCLKECLLTDQNLLKIITKLNQTTHFFSRILFRFFQTIQADETLNQVKDEGLYPREEETKGENAQD